MKHLLITIQTPQRTGASRNASQNSAVDKLFKDTYTHFIKHMCDLFLSIKMLCITTTEVNRKAKCLWNNMHYTITALQNIFVS